MQAAYQNGDYGITRGGLVGCGLFEKFDAAASERILPLGHVRMWGLPAGLAGLAGTAGRAGLAELIGLAELEPTE